MALSPVCFPRSTGRRLRPRTHLGRGSCAHGRSAGTPRGLAGLPPSLFTTQMCGLMEAARCIWKGSKNQQGARLPIQLLMWARPCDFGLVTAPALFSICDRRRLHPSTGLGPYVRPGHHSEPPHGRHGEGGALGETVPGGPGVSEPWTLKLCIKAICHHITLLAFLQKRTCSVYTFVGKK